jgi:tetratricopeptide (TPR) repeat protein
MIEENARKSYSGTSDEAPNNMHEDALPLPSNKDDENLHGWLEQAMNLIREGDLEQAEGIYRFLIEVGVENEKVFANLAGLCQMRNAHDESLALLARAVQLKPASPQAHLLIANAMEARGEYKAAINKIRHALELDENSAEAHHNMGFLLGRTGNHTGAVESYLKAIDLKPEYPDAYNNLGNSLKQLGDMEGARSAYRQAIGLKSNFADAHLNLGNSLMELGNMEGARSAYSQAIGLKPDFADAHLNHALLMLLQGDYLQGWQEYEWRLQRSPNATGMPHATPSCRRWSGEDLNSSDPVLLVCEQGLGDTIHMVRYVNTLRQRGHPITLAAQQCLHALISCSGVEADLVTAEDLARFSGGYWLPLFSLPGILNVTPNNPIVVNPYLQSPPSLVHQWKSLLEPERSPVVAINWQGNPEAEKNGMIGRSFSLELMSPIARGLQGSLLSLQKGYGSEQLESCSFRDRFVHCQQVVDSYWDFLDVAAIIANCDLVITSDTCIAHLAGAMGHPTWLLLPKVPDWRWGLQKESTFWYPSMRIFRQTDAGDWKGVMSRVTRALRELGLCT